MGRHANGQRNNRLAGWLWILLISILALVGAGIGWFTLREDNNTATTTAAQTCPEGNYDLTVWAADGHKDAAEALAGEYNKAKKVVRDRCVTARIEATPDDAAQGSIAAAQGVASVWIPQDARAAAEALKKAPPSVSKPQAPVINDAVVFSLGNGIGIDEQATRAGADFAAFVEKTQGARLVAVEDLASGKVQVGDSAPTDAPATGAAGAKAEQPGVDGTTDLPVDTTFVLDTSGSMGLVEGQATRLDNIRSPLADVMTGVGSRGGFVGLWNYSSPLSAGVTRPYRDNVDISERNRGDQAVGVLNQLSFGGSTHTYESLSAAYQSAIAAARSSGAEERRYRVVLITDGPNDGGRLSAADAISEIKRLYADVPVQLQVIAIGQNVDTGDLQQLAAAGGGEVFRAADSLSIKEPLAAATR